MKKLSYKKCTFQISIFKHKVLNDHKAIIVNAVKILQNALSKQTHLTK